MILVDAIDSQEQGRTSPRPSRARQCDQGIHRLGEQSCQAEPFSWHTLPSSIFYSFTGISFGLRGRVRSHSRLLISRRSPWRPWALITVMPQSVICPSAGLMTCRIPIRLSMTPLAMGGSFLQYARGEPEPDRQGLTVTNMATMSPFRKIRRMRRNEDSLERFSSWSRSMPGLCPMALFEQ